MTFSLQVPNIRNDSFEGNGVISAGLRQMDHVLFELFSADVSGDKKANKTGLLVPLPTVPQGGFPCRYTLCVILTRPQMRKAGVMERIGESYFGRYRELRPLSIVRIVQTIYMMRCQRLVDGQCSITTARNNSHNSYNINNVYSTANICA